MYSITLIADKVRAKNFKELVNKKQTKKKDEKDSK
jgi:hypothetical protein